MPFIESPKFPGAVAGVDHLHNWEGLTAAGPGELAASISDVVDTFDLKAGHGARYPADNFPVFIAEEAMIVALRTGDTFSGVTRGAFGTTPVSHSADDPVEHFVIAASLNRMAAEVEALEKALQPLALAMPIGGVSPVIPAEFSWANQGTATTQQ